MTNQPRAGRWLARVASRCVVLALLVLAGLLGAAAPALAHASLERTEPAADSVLQAPPTLVVLHFSEPVGTSLGTVKVLAPDGARADVGRVEGSGRDVRVPLREGLAEGTYVVAWRVVSADSHPVSGGFSFSIGAVSAAADADLDDLAAPGSTRRAAAIARFAGYAGLVLLAGALVLVAVVWPTGAMSGRVRRIVMTGWGLALGGSVLALLVQGVSSAGLGLASVVTEPSLLGDVLRTRYGQLHVARVAALLAFTPGVALSVASRARASRVPALVTAAALGFLAVTWAYAGHAGVKSPVPVTVGIDAVHLLAVSTWLGGLVVVLSALTRSADLAAAAPRWSRLAFGSVVLLVVTGTVTGWREVQSWDALWHTRYGQLLTAKTALVAVMVGLGAIGRELVRRRTTHLLHHSVRQEAALGAGVLAITAVLVATVPANAAYFEPFSETTDAGPVTVELDVDVAKVGTNEVHIYVTDGHGKAVEVEEVTARASLPSRDLGPIDVPVHPESKGHVETLAFSLPYAGEWTFALDIRLTDIDSYPATFTVPVR